MTPPLCSSCGEPLNIPPEFDGGVVICSNASCAQTTSFEKSGHLGRVRVWTQRNPGDGPALLEKIPPTFLSSPAMYPIGFAIAVLYGIVLYQVVSSQKIDRAARENERRVAAVESPGVGKPSVETLPADVATATTRASDQPTSIQRNQPEAPLALKTEATPAASNTTPVEKAVSSVEKPSSSVKTEVASKEAAPPTPVAPAPPTDPALIWSKLQGIVFDCKTRIEPARLTIEIPGKLHVLSPELNQQNAPRFLRSVEGDVSLSVMVRGDFSPGSEPLTGFPLTYQGAGLLFWYDDNNFLRFERAERFLLDRGKSNILLLETCRDGKTSKAITKDVRDVDMTLRIDRKGAEFQCKYSIDGRSWIEFRRQNLALPATVSAGISASNVSPQPFVPRFEKFEMNVPSAKEAKGT